MYDDPRWGEVDTWASSVLGLRDDALDRTLRRSEESGLPPIQVSECQGRLLEILVRSTESKRVLEIGTLGGFSTIFLGRGVGAGGSVVSLELDAEHAAVARRSLADAGLTDVATVIEGDAHASLAKMTAEGAEPFDFVFVDAEKSGYAEYFRAVLDLVRTGSMIVADNVVRRGAVVDTASEDPNVRGVRAFTELVASTPNVSATVLQTVGSKGYDGLLVAVVE